MHSLAVGRMEGARYRNTISGDDSEESITLVIEKPSAREKKPTVPPKPARAQTVHTSTTPTANKPKFPSQVQKEGFKTSLKVPPPVPPRKESSRHNSDAGIRT